jgi:RNA polymerase sigma-70 factor (ECF subfamily)
MALLAEDVTMWADGGGKARGAALHPLSGRDTVGRFIAGSTRFADGKLTQELSEINGELAMVIREDGETRVVITIVASGDQISEIRVIGNPDKLGWVDG